MIMKAIVTHTPLLEPILQWLLMGLMVVIGCTLAWTSRQAKLRAPGTQAGC